jgi:hypothetical protein
MKKMLSITFLAAVMAAGTAFAGKLTRATEWMLNDNSYVYGVQSDIKLIYCGGANNIQCAIMTSQPYILVLRP